MDSIAAKVTEEVLVFFENGDAHARACKQVAGRNPGWASADKQVVREDSGIQDAPSGTGAGIEGLAASCAGVVFYPSRELSSLPVRSQAFST